MNTFLLIHAVECWLSAVILLKKEKEGRKEWGNCLCTKMEISPKYTYRVYHAWVKKRQNKNINIFKIFRYIYMERCK